MDDSPSAARGDTRTDVSTGRTDARGSATRARARLRELADQLRDDRDTVDDPRTRALFGTTANLLAALDDAFADVEDHLAAARPTGLRLVPDPPAHPGT